MNCDIVGSFILKTIGKSLAIFFGLLLLIVALSVFSINPVEWLFQSTFGVFHKTPEPLTDHEWESLSELIMNGRILTAEDLVSQVSDFYTSIINTLIVLISLLGFVAFMYIKAKTSETMEEATELRVDLYFEKSKFDDKLITLVEKSYRNVDSDLQHTIESIVEQVENLSDKVEILEFRDDIPSQITTDRS